MVVYIFIIHSPISSRHFSLVTGFNISSMLNVIKFTEKIVRKNDSNAAKMVWPPKSLNLTCIAEFVSSNFSTNLSKISLSYLIGEEVWVVVEVGAGGGTEDGNGVALEVVFDSLLVIGDGTGGEASEDEKAGLGGDTATPLEIFMASLAKESSSSFSGFSKVYPSGR